MVMMYMHEPGDASSDLEPLTPGLRAAMILPALGTFFLGMAPGMVLAFAQSGAALVK
jgi:NADH:ubiquinone oxidoreductase subunit 2 (subunit N)